MKTHAPLTPTPAAQRQRAPARAAARVPATALDASPRAVAQRQQIAAAFGSTVQRAAPDEEMLQGKFSTVQRAAPEEEMLQGRFEGAAAKGPAPAAPNRTGMPGALKAGVEALSGLDLSDVRVQANSDRPAAIGAHAYAQGNDIHLAPGQEQHLPHEAWHVVQQRQGRVPATLQMAGVAVNDNPALEAEADVMGAKAAAAR